MNFKILHTSDWHLGARLLSKERDEEMENFLDFLLNLINQEEIDLMIIAGDIFDTGVPSNTARRMYYSFLTKLNNTHCKNVIIIGGNHDSPSMLEAPKEVLELLKIFVIGAATEDENGNIIYEKEIVEIKNSENIPVAVIAAVPFLRDRDLMKSVAGQSYTDRVQAMREGLKNHYTTISQLLEKHKNIPKIASGHLFADKTILSDNQVRQEGENDIHIGNLAQVDMSCFDKDFTYIALGHIHKSQTPGGKENVRYSGSPICMSFAERNDTKSVTVVEFENDKIKSIDKKNIPQIRKLIRIKGNLNEINEQLSIAGNDEKLTTWGELIYTEKLGQTEIEEIRERAFEKNIEILKHGFESQKKLSDEQTNLTHNKNLSELSVYEIFDLKCHSEDYNEEEIKNLRNTFDELISWMKDSDDK